MYNSSGDYDKYSSSTVKTWVDNWYKNNISANAKTAVVEDDGNKMFLLTLAQEDAINPDVLKCPKADGATDDDGNYLWWLSSPSDYMSIYVAVVLGSTGRVDYHGAGGGASNTLGVRPALKLSLLSASFSSVNLTGGANATTSEGDTSQYYFGPISEMTTVTYTANAGYKFPENSDMYTTTSGITITRTSDTVVTVSGTPTAGTNATITVPDAAAIPATAPTITGPADLELTYGYAGGSVNITASAADGHSITGYQWYSNTTNSNENGTVINGATSAGITVPTDKSAGTTEYYYCVVTATRTDNGETATTSCNAAAVTVRKAANPLTYAGTQTADKTFSTTTQTATLEAAASAEGTLSYGITSQKNGQDDVTYFTLDGTTLTLAASVPTGTYTVVVRATAEGNNNYNSGMKDSTVTVTVGAAASVPATVTANNPLIYNGQAQALVTVDNTTLVGGTMWYAIGTENAAPDFDRRRSYFLLMETLP